MSSIGRIYRRLQALVLPLALACLCCSAAQACEPNEEDCVQVGDWQFAVIMGLGSHSNPLSDGDDLPLIVVPQISYYGKRFYLENTNAGFTLFENARHSFGVAASVGRDHIYFRDRFNLGNISFGGSAGGFGSANTGSQVDTPAPVVNPPAPPVNPPNLLLPPPAQPEPVQPEPTQPETGIEPARPSLNLKSLEDRQVAVYMGAEYSYFGKSWDFRAQVMQDVRDVHGGHTAQFAISKLWRLGEKTQARLSIGSAWQSDKVVDYYYGLRDSERGEAQPHVPLKSGFKPFIRSDWRRRINQKWTWHTTLYYQSLSESMRSSELVSDDSTRTVFTGVEYRF